MEVPDQRINVNILKVHRWPLGRRQSERSGGRQVSMTRTWSPLRSKG